MSYRVNLCSFSAVDPPPLRRGYGAFRDAVLEAGRFSVFEATESEKRARLYSRLARDPAVRLIPQTFPWTKVVAR